MDGYVTIGTELDTKSFDAQIDYVKSQLDDIEDKLKKADMGFEVGDTKKLEAQYEKLTDKLRNLIKKKEEFNKTDFSNIQNSNAVEQKYNRYLADNAHNFITTTFGEFLLIDGGR